MKISKAFGRTVLYAASTFYMKGISLFMVPLVVRYLEVEEYGRLEYIGSFAIFLSVIVGFGLEDTLYRYSGRQKSTSESATIAAHIYGLVICISIAFLGLTIPLLMIFSSSVDSHASLYLCLILLLTLSLEGIIAVPLGWMRMKDNFKLYCSINTARASFQAILTLLFLYLGRGVEGVFEAGFLSTILTATVCFVYQHHSSGIHFNKKRSLVFIKYALPIVASGFLAFSLNGLDRWILAENTSLSDLAFYAVTGKFAIALTIAMQPYGMWWSPARFSLLNEHDGHQTASRYATYGLLQVAFFSLIIGLLAPVIVVTLFSPEFHSCIVLIAPLLAVFAAKESAEFLSIGCFAKDSTSKQMSITMISAVVGVLLMLLTTPTFGLIGLILSLLIAQITRTVLLFIAAQRETKLAIPCYRILLLLASVFSSIALVNDHFVENLLGYSTFELIISSFGAWIVCLILFLLACSSLFARQLPIVPALKIIESYIARSFQKTAN